MKSLKPGNACPECNIGTLIKVSTDNQGSIFMDCTTCKKCIVSPIFAGLPFIRNWLSPQTKRKITHQYAYAEQRGGGFWILKNPHKP